MKQEENQKKQLAAIWWLKIKACFPPSDVFNLLRDIRVK